MDNLFWLSWKPFAEALGWTIIHSLWQIALIGIILKAILMISSNKTALFRYWASMTCLIIILFLTSFTFYNNWNNNMMFGGGNSIDVNKLQEEITRPPTMDALFSPLTFFLESKAAFIQLIEPVLPFLSILWFLGIAFFASKILIGFIRLKHLSYSGVEKAALVWEEKLAQFCQLYGIKRKVFIGLSDKVVTPITYRFFKPIILFPISLYTCLTAEQIEVLLLHELAHIKRHDYVFNLIQSLIEVLFFYHPLVWWMSEKVRQERELCCDDWVMKIRHQPMLYAETLTQIQALNYSFKTTLAMSANGNKGVFTQRIYRLFNQQNQPSSRRKSAISLLLLLFCVMAMAFYPNTAHLELQEKENSAIIVEKVEQDTTPIFEFKSKDGDMKLHSIEVKKNANNKGDGEKSTVKIREIKKDKIKVIGYRSMEEEPLYIIDGKKMKAGDHPTKLNNISPDKIESIYVLYGDSATKLYGEEGKNSVIVIDTKKDANLLIEGEDADKKVIIKQSKDGKEVTVERKGEEDIPAIIGSEIKVEAFGDTDVDNNIVKEGVTLDWISTDKMPDYIIDGVKMEKDEGTAFMKQLDPKDIATINVMKGKTKRNDNGEETANNVIIVTTKAANKLHKDGKVTEDVLIEEVKKMEEQLKSKTKVDKNVSYAIGSSVKIKRKGEPAKSSSSFQIRSSTNLSGKEPLFIIDDVKIKKDGPKHLKGLKPDNIKSINVLKGASAEALYGEEGKDGVIIITTKKAAKLHVEKEGNKLIEAKKQLEVKEIETTKKEEANSIIAENNLTKIKKKDLTTRRVGAMTLFPNPTDAEANIELDLKKAGAYQLNIYDMNGKLIQNVANQHFEKGKHQFKWNSSQYHAGTYFVVLSNEKPVLSKSLIIK
jgi:TonB-dependent SusC/RagA subfamily outer membrane receptor